MIYELHGYPDPSKLKDELSCNDAFLGRERRPWYHPCEAPHGIVEKATPLAQQLQEFLSDFITKIPDKTVGATHYLMFLNTTQFPQETLFEIQKLG